MSITISGGGGVPGITVETDPTALKLTGGTITSNGTTAALRIVQQGTGNVLEVFDQNGDPSPLTIDTNGNIGIGTNPINGIKLEVAGGARFTDTVQAQGSLYVTGTLLLNGLPIGQAVSQYLFSGGTLTTTSSPITSSIYYYDGMNYYYSGQYDSNNNEIATPIVGTNYYDVNWNGNAFVSTQTSSSYTQGGEFVASFYASNAGNVQVYANGSGGLDYSPASQ